MSHPFFILITISINLLYEKDKKKGENNLFLGIGRTKEGILCNSYKKAKKIKKKL